MTPWGDERVGRRVALTEERRDRVGSSTRSGLVGSYFADAVAATPGAEHLAVSRTSDFLECVKTAQASQHDGVGLGRNVVMTQAAVSGNALVMGEAVIHLAAFMDAITKWVGPRFVAPGRRCE